MRERERERERERWRESDGESEREKAVESKRQIVEVTERRREERYYRHYH